ncbi:MAG TPA: hypothetical protein VF452_16795 [Candidatus Binatia bacterium]
MQPVKAIQSRHSFIAGRAAEDSGAHPLGDAQYCASVQEYTGEALAMTFIHEKQLWCSDCRRNHVIKVYSPAELTPQRAARFFVEGDYSDQLKKHTVCGSCGDNITPHKDIDILEIGGEWKEICLECFQKGQPC